MSEETTKSTISEPAIRAVTELSNAARRSSCKTISQEREGVYFIEEPGGKLERHLAEPGWERHKFYSPAELKKFIEDFNDDGAAKGGAIFISNGEVRFVHDIADRREFSVVALAYTQQFATVQELAARPRPMSHREFYAFCRIQLHNCLGATNLLSLLKEVKFNVDKTGSGTIERTQESLGRSLVAKVCGVDALPEEIGLYLPVYVNHTVRVHVRCALEILLQEEAFRLVPLPGQIDEAIAEAIGDVRQTLVEGFDAAPPVYLGVASA